MCSCSCIRPCPHIYAFGFEQAFSNACSHLVWNMFTPRFKCIYASFRMCSRLILNALYLICTTNMDCTKCKGSGIACASHFGMQYVL